MQRTKAIFLDRDGTLIQDIGRPQHADEIVVLPGVGEALSKLRSLGYELVICTNQAAIGRGELMIKEFDAQNSRMKELLWEQGGEIDRIYYCPHRPEDLCQCRKPRPGMLLQAMRDMKLEKSRLSAMVGDKWDDMQAGKNAKIRGLKIDRNSDGLYQLVKAKVFR
jgi:D-glycero-D-manno-heptose 1,7-bisphosphate phosphatase